MKTLLLGVALVFCCLSTTAQYEFNAIGGGLSYMKSLSEKRSGFGYQAGFGGEIKDNWFLSLGYGNYSSIESVDPRVPANYNVEKYRLGVLYLMPKGKVKPFFGMSVAYATEEVKLLDRKRNMFLVGPQVGLSLTTEGRWTTGVSLIYYKGLGAESSDWLFPQVGLAYRITKN